MQSSHPIRRWRIAALALLALALTASLASAAAPPSPPVAQTPSKATYQPTRFTQIRRDKAGKPLAMQEAIVRYVPLDASKGNEGLTVDLVGVVHVGDRDFYQTLNKKLKGYDVVLYEGVKGQPKSKLLLAVAAVLAPLIDHDSTAKQLALASQSDHIDYKASNFVHADVTWDEWGDRVEKKGHTKLSITLGVASDVVKMLGGKSEPTSKDPLMRKIQMAEYFAKTQGSKDMGATIEMLLIEVRNDACIDALKKQIAAGKKKIAIFYGSAHNPDFERRLMQDFGMKRQGVEWVDAWDLTGKSRDATKGK
jgi:hypothetical protein